ncbi:hypothetical protein PF002_g16736 [Phytophthora fragariae]|uniref:RxLR effector protein n=1 Tax=Phytophthora fragariae TaxID=53985 RepID=A0A6A3YG05_9STRA|nr:hypothetical protein PF002_g16736 [Phytophthora fragariae]
MVVSVSLLPALLLASWLMSFETDTSLRRHSVLPPESSSRLVQPFSSSSIPSVRLFLVAPASPVVPSLFPIGSP